MTMISSLAKNLMWLMIEHEAGDDGNPDVHSLMPSPLMSKEGGAQVLAERAEIKRDVRQAW